MLRRTRLPGVIIDDMFVLESIFAANIRRFFDNRTSFSKNMDLIEYLWEKITGFEKKKDKYEHISGFSEQGKGFHDQKKPAGHISE